MTAAAEEPRRSPLHALAMLLGHYNTIISRIASLVIFATIVYRAVWTRPLNDIATAAILAVMGVAVTTQLLDDRYHDRQLCLRCLNAAPMLNPQAAVDKHINTLRRSHFSRWLITLLAVLLIAAYIIASSVPLSGWPWPARALLIVAATVGFIDTFYMNYATVVHRRLQPWCPWCKRRGFGGESLPDPDPEPTIKADR